MPLCKSNGIARNSEDDELKTVPGTLKHFLWGLVFFVFSTHQLIMILTLIYYTFFLFPLGLIFDPDTHMCLLISLSSPPGTASKSSPLARSPMKHSVICGLSSCQFQFYPPVIRPRNKCLI